MLKNASIDWRILRVVNASSDPMETLHRINTKQYSVKTLLDMLEVLDIKETILEDEKKRMVQAANKNK